MKILKNSLLILVIYLVLVPQSFAAQGLGLNTHTTLSTDKLLEQARDLESVMISVMIEPMFPDGKDSDLFGGGHGSSVFRTMIIQEYGKVLSKSNGLGVAENIAKKLR